MDRSGRSLARTAFRGRLATRSSRPLGWAFIACAAVGGCADAGPGYFPLRAGRHYQYAVRVNTVFLEKHSKYLVETLPPRELDGQRVFPRLVNGTLLQFYAATPAGIVRVATRNLDGTQAQPARAVHRVLPQTPAPGARWHGETVTGVLETVVDPFRKIYRLELPVRMEYTVAAVGEAVRVPAGMFRGCLRVHGSGHAEHDGDSMIRKAVVGVEQDDWYAPGIGLVRSYRLETTTNKNLLKGEYRLELEVTESR